jgi:hypothetical protein
MLDGARDAAEDDFAMGAGQLQTQAVKLKVDSGGLHRQHLVQQC